MSIEVRPVTPSRWDDLVELFGDNRGTSSCWCMWWRQTAAEFDARLGAPNREAMQQLVQRRRVPGLVAYQDATPVGWVSVAPREEFGRIERSRTLGGVPGDAVWSIVCFYIHRSARRSGVGTALLRAAIAHAAERGARIVEAYPVDPAGRKKQSAELFTGVPSMFEAAGFREVERRSPGRPIMRLPLRA